MAESGRGRLKGSLGVPEGRVRPLAGFLRRRRLPLRVVCGGPCLVRIAEAPGRKACTRSTLYPGGWIACPVARGMAARLGIPPRQARALLDLLDIKVRRCELGCF